VFAIRAVMIVLDNLGISLTAVWTTLGGGQRAVALALQDTLSNFFAGVYLRLDGPVRVGDYIKLGKRGGRFCNRAKLVSTIVTNYSLPRAAALAASSTRIRSTPFVRFIPGFGDSWLTFSLICRVTIFVDQYLVQHELRKRISCVFVEKELRSRFSA
jgi:small-conductance mechanosensitive channel